MSSSNFDLLMYVINLSNMFSFYIYKSIDC